MEMTSNTLTRIKSVLIKIPENYLNLKDILPKEEVSYQEEDSFTKYISSYEIDSILEGQPILGDTDAAITIVQYADPGCSFCKRHNDDGTIEKIREEFGGEVNSTIKFLDNYDPEKTEALACALKQDSDNYYSIVDDMFQGTKTIDSILSDNDIDLTQWQDCIDSKDFESIISQTSEEFDYYELGGTPGHIIINNETNEYIILSGAYPAETFIKIIEEIL